MPGGIKEYTEEMLVGSRNLPSDRIDARADVMYQSTISDK